jgi:hypothetical protein
MRIQEAYGVLMKGQQIVLVDLEGAGADQESKTTRMTVLELKSSVRGQELVGRIPSEGEGEFEVEFVAPVIPAGQRPANVQHGVHGDGDSWSGGTKRERDVEDRSSGRTAVSGDGERDDFASDGPPSKIHAARSTSEVPPPTAPSSSSVPCGQPVAAPVARAAPSSTRPSERIVRYNVETSGGWYTLYYVANGSSETSMDDHQFADFLEHDLLSVVSRLETSLSDMSGYFLSREEDLRSRCRQPLGQQIRSGQIVHVEFDKSYPGMWTVVVDDDFKSYFISSSKSRLKDGKY